MYNVINIQLSITVRYANTLTYLYLHGVPIKTKHATFFLDFQNYSATVRFTKKFTRRPIDFLPHLDCVVAIPCEIQKFKNVKILVITLRDDTPPPMAV